MIFYFTGTGNSLYAAQRIELAFGNPMVDIGRAVKHGVYEYDVSEQKRIGFVVPTFAGTLPGIVGEFLEKLTLLGYTGQYVFGAFTCGESSEQECAALRTMLENKGIGFNGSFTIVMPDNFIVWSNVPPEDKLSRILENADRMIDSMIEKLASYENGEIQTGAPRMLYMPIQNISSGAGTSVLYADEKCTGCGKCAERCPLGCVKISDGKPTWEGRCTMCFACLHRCPRKAIQHGKDTLNKGRYVNPKAKF